MSTLSNRDGSALLVIDVQRGVFADAYDRDGVVSRIAELVSGARDAGVPVVWVRHSDPGLELGSDGWQIVDELAPSEGEAIVEKLYGDSFEATTLESVLGELNVGELIVTGGQTDFCVRSTLHGGFVRGYDVTLIGDAHSTEDIRQWVQGVPSPAELIAHTNAYWANQKAPGRTARVVSTADVTFEN
ncbi:cysteine hydrolase family protein [Microbacterium mitrae]|uniref:Cysteine hydrolase n=1 Tax=Microbacterium mitrae TaxID=664640 RepID=A0A5C8HR07_9MICO|nr:cysteine hydrolase family protein [Microbacterium mitrae]TXK05568.1 cysteine hydrolase [Microbacterium mitrae]